MNLASTSCSDCINLKPYTCARDIDFLFELLPHDCSHHGSAMGPGNNINYRVSVSFDPPGKCIHPFNTAAL